MDDGPYGQALAAKEAGDWAETLRLARLALDEAHNDCEATGRSAMLAGVAAYEMGLSDEAIRCYRAAAVAFGDAGNDERVAAARFNEGLALFRASRLVEAIVAYEASLAIFESQGLERNRATCLMNLGNACRHAGKLAEALALYQQARSAFQSLGDEDRLARCFLNAGNVLADLGRLRESSGMYVRAREQFHAIGADQHEAGAIVNLAELALRDGNAQEAIELIRLAREIFERIRLPRFLAECDLLEGRASKSLDLVQRAVDSYEAFGDRRQAASARIAAADLEANSVVGLDHLEQAAKQLIAFREEFHEPSAAAQASKPLAEVSGRLVRALCKEGKIDTAWDRLQVLRERRSQRHGGRGDGSRISHLRAEIDAFDRELATRPEVDGAIRRKREAALAELSASEFRNERSQADREFAGARNLAAVQGAMDEAEVIVEATVSPSGIDLIGVGKRSLAHRHVEIDPSSLTSAIQMLRESVDRPSGQWRKCPVLEPLKAAIADLCCGSSVLIWCPDGLLEATPVAPWLLELGIAWMQSGSSNFWLSGTASAGGPPLVVGISQHGPHLGALPEARREAEFVAGILSRSKLLMDEEASLGNVQAAAHGAKIIHLATHAIANESVPLYSRLELASGSLYGRDLLDWGISCDLVFLSACSTAEGQRSAAGSSIGLAWAMLAAGARTVVASSWPVHDLAAQLWVQQFYQSYVGARDPIAAHRDACRYMSADSNYGSPHFWATWKVLGSR